MDTPTSISELAQKLKSNNLDLSHVAVQQTGKVLYQVNDLLMTPEDAKEVADGVVTLEDVQRRNEHTAFAPLTLLAPAKDIVPILKTVYDVGKDGWSALKKTPHLEVQVFNSHSEQNEYLISIRVTNRSKSGIYLETIALAERSLPGGSQTSITQATLMLTTIQNDGFGHRTRSNKSCLPWLLQAESDLYDNSYKNFVMTLPHSYRNNRSDNYAVADLSFWKLDEAAPEKLSFIFHLR